MSTQLIIAILAIAGTAALVKSLVGFGYPLLLLPVLAQFLDPVDAILMVAPSNLFMNAGLVIRLRAHRKSAKTLKGFVLWGLLGAIVGTLLLPQLSVDLVRLFLFVILVAFILNRVSGLKFTMGDETARRLTPAVGGVAGLLQGATGLSGPIVSPWFLSLGTSREAFVFSIATFFGLTQAGQAIVAAVEGLYTVETMLIGLAMIPLAALSLPLGERMRERITVESFERIVIVLLSISAASLLARIL